MICRSRFNLLSRYVHSIEEGQTASDSCFDSKKCLFEEVSRNLQSALSVTRFIAIDIYWSTHFQHNCVVFLENLQFSLFVAISSWFGRTRTRNHVPVITNFGYWSPPRRTTRCPYIISHICLISGVQH